MCVFGGCPRSQSVADEVNSNILKVSCDSSTQHQSVLVGKHICKSTAVCVVSVCSGSVLICTEYAQYCVPHFMGSAEPVNKWLFKYLLM